MLDHHLDTHVNIRMGEKIPVPHCHPEVWTTTTTKSQSANMILRTDGEADLLLLIGQSIVVVEVKCLFSVVAAQHTLL